MPPTLSRALVSSPAFQDRGDLLAPAPELLELPEKAVQFGTGAFLRGFVEFFLDAANRAGRFGGRVVMVGSTGSGRDQVLNEQDGLYTLAVQGISDGAPFREHRVIGSVSRALSARGEWDRVLALARAPELELVFSNTTEVGIALDEEDRPDLQPPRSFPGKLVRFLYERATAFGFAPERGVVVIPCELIEDNGDRLREIVLALAERWALGDDFARWVREAVPFCNTLVDRIVPGAPDGEERERLVAELGYEDELLTVCEPYRLFAIQGGDALRARLGFADADPGIVVADDVAPFRERKVRLLNGAHSAMVPAALLCGCETVREAVEDERVGPFLRRVLLEEIVPSLEAPGAERFAAEVLDRFANPHVRHALADITLQQTMKLRVRVVPSITEYARRTGRAPASLAFAFAAYLLWARGGAGERRADDQGERIRGLWDALPDDSPAALRELARAACADVETWGTDLSAVPGFAEAVGEALEHAAREGVPAALEAHLAAASRA
ncbi:MAG TPA: tagaturonate reductase [Longimicrobiaceae bacterium]|nr:tagaturonate reductase [Longimicrobiaceae bacterium]